MSGSNFDGGFNKLVCENDESNEEPPHCTNSNSNQRRRQVSIPKVTPERLPAVSLAALAAVLLIVDISLGAHYNHLTDTHLTNEDIKLINDEMINIQNSYKTAIDTMKSAQKQLDIEKSRQKETNWELEHQNKREANYKDQIDKITKDIASMRTHLPMITDGCKHCPPGWILVNSLCYYFSFSDIAGQKTWQKARDFCKLHGGDLAVIDSKDKENATVRILINNQDPSKSLQGFWIGLRDFQEEGTWKWSNGKELVEGYWYDGEPNNDNEDCAAVYASENFFKSWKDNRCSSMMKWICEKPKSL